MQPIQASISLLYIYTHTHVCGRDVLVCLFFICLYILMWVVNMQAALDVRIEILATVGEDDGVTRWLD